MKYLDKLISAGYGVHVLGKYHGVMVVVGRPDMGSRVFERPTAGKALRAAWKELGARNP